MNEPTLAFVDTETTGLVPGVAEVWEVAIVTVTPGHPGTEHCWQVEVDPEYADPVSLDIGRFHERYGTTRRPLARTTVASMVHRYTAGAIIAGANPGFDVDHLGRLLRAHRLEPEWHYRPLNVEDLAAGRYGWPHAVSLSRTADALGIDLDVYERHTALDDALLARAVYDRIRADPPADATEVPE